VSGEKPSTSCWYSVSRKNIPKSIVPRSKPITFAAVSVRRRKILRSRSGERERRSMTMAAAISTAKPTNEAIVSAEPHPTVGARVSA
jgi:hypothetical protein